MPQLRKFSEGNRISIDYNATRTVSMAAHVYERIKPEYYMRRPIKAMIPVYKIKETASPGGDLDTVFVNKRQAFVDAVDIAIKHWDNIHKNYVPNNTIYTVGGRDKRIFDKEPGEDVSSRAVMMHDMVEFLLAKPYTAQLEDHFTKDFFNPIVFGFKKTQFGTERINYKRKLYDFSLEGDWSNFDSTVLAEKIIVAFGICRSFFPEGRDIDRAFCYFCDGFLNKTVVCPDGNFFKFYKGVPSGNAWTSIINSIVNCLMIEEIFRSYRAFGWKDFDYQVLGDDVEVFSDKEFYFTEKKLSEWIVNRFNAKFSIKRIGKPINDDPDNSTTFLKLASYYDENVVRLTTPPRVLYERCSAIQSKATSTEDVDNFFHSQLESYITDKLSIRFICNLCAWYRVSNNKKINAMDYLRHRNMLIEHIDNVNKMVYNTIKPNFKLLKYVQEDNERKVIYKEGSTLNQFTKGSIVKENWLKDNSFKNRKDKVSINSRKAWFILQTGERTNLNVLLNETLPSMIPYKKEQLRGFNKRIFGTGLSKKVFKELFESYIKFGFDNKDPPKLRISFDVKSGFSHVR